MKNRYLKQELCSFIGSEGQERIRDKHVLIIGVGALGSASAEMLVRSGIGALTIIDRDYVELSICNGSSYIVKRMQNQHCQK